MAYRKATIRRMSEVTRRYARLINELDSLLTRAKNLLGDIQQLELDSKALVNVNGNNRHNQSQPQPCTDCAELRQQIIEGKASMMPSKCYPTGGEPCPFFKPIFGKERVG